MHCTLIRSGDCGVAAALVYIVQCFALAGTPWSPDDDLGEARIACTQNGTQRNILLRPCALQHFGPEYFQGLERTLYKAWETYYLPADGTWQHLQMSGQTLRKS